MADNTTIRNAAGTSVIAATDELSDSSQSPKVTLVDGTGSPTPISPATSGKQDTIIARLPTALGQGTMATSLKVVLPSDQTVKSGPDIINANGSTLTRPGNTTPYSIGDAVSDNGTAGSVTAQTVTFSDTNDEPVVIERVRLVTTDTGFGAAAQVRMWLYNSDPTASTGVGGGDNSAFSNKKAGFVGCMTGTFRAFSDGGVAILTPDEGNHILCLPGTGARTLWWQLQVLTAPTPSANSTTFTPTFEGYQGRA